MIVKDIRRFREFFKTNIVKITLPNRDPHFAGSLRQASDDHFGFFSMLNGHGDIENKLNTILNIAGDSQAIYEFMQNAVDANSTFFYLGKYGTDESPYLIVLNNGDYFDLQSVVSILAIGANAKYRNPDNIGQFGVGFKLAHRLIGADNSLRELLDENKGPLLFSWANGEINDLTTVESILLEDPACQGYLTEASSKSLAPWLFKIIATNFPCLPNDPVYDGRGKVSDGLFTQEDLDALKGAAQLCLEQCEKAKYFNTGTLIIIPLHPPKVPHILGGIPKGLEVAASIVSRRAKKVTDITTQIKDKVLEPESLFTELWELPQDITAGRLGNERVKNVELMFLYCNPLIEDPFNNKPQFYRYFPMSLEQHGFRFAIHSNALTLSSARTELQENDTNKFLFSCLVPRIADKLIEYSQNKKEHFCHLYLSVLLSHRGQAGSSYWIQGRDWLETALWQPLIKLLSSHIPIADPNGFALATTTENVHIKDSMLPIETWYKIEQVKWFYWDNKNHPTVCIEAHAETKLCLQTINILDVLKEESSISFINSWLEETPQNTIKLFEELNTIKLEDIDKDVVWKSIRQLRLWWFGTDVYSINELHQNDGLKYHLINYGPLSVIKEIIGKKGLFVSDHCLELYEEVKKFIRDKGQNLLPYLRDFKELNEHLSLKLSAGNDLIGSEKATIFKEIEAAVRSTSSPAKRIEIMRVLTLFSNKRNEVKALFQLTSLSNVPDMLQGWRISEGELALVNLAEYLSDSLETIYEHITRPFWNDISSKENFNPEYTSVLFAYVKKCYKLKPTMGVLEPTSIFFTENGLRQPAFFHHTLAALNEHEYSRLLNVLKYANIYLPQRSLLEYYKEAPFLLAVNDGINLLGMEQGVSSEEAQTLIKWLIAAFPGTTKSFLFESRDDQLVYIKPKPNSVHQFISGKQSIQEYIDAFFTHRLVPLPKCLNQLLGNEVLHGEKLLERLIYEAQSIPPAQNQLLSIIISEGNDELKEKLLTNLAPLQLTTEIEGGSTKHLALQLYLSIQKESLRRQVFGKRAFLPQNDSWIALEQISNRGSDELNLMLTETITLSLSVNQLLGGIANAVNEYLTHILKHWEALFPANHSDLAALLGIGVQRNCRDVWTQMLSNLVDGKIQNCQQLLFALILMKDKQLRTDNIQVETKEGWQPLSQTFYWQSMPFIPTSKTLHQRYRESITSILPNSVICLQHEAFGLIALPHLNDGLLIMPGITTIDDKYQNLFCAFLFEQWEKSGSPASIRLNEPGQSWGNLIGIDPTALILQKEYSLPEEQVPISLFTDEIRIDETSLDAFLMALGALGNETPVVKTRRFFNKVGGSIASDMPMKQIIATLKWLSVNNISVNRDDIAIFYRNLAGKATDLWYFPAYTELNSGMKIVSIKEEVYLLQQTDLAWLRNQGVEFDEIALAAKAPIINGAILQDWTHYLSQNVKILEMTNNDIDWEKAFQESIELSFPFYIEWKKKFPHLEIRWIRNGDIPKRIIVAGNVLKEYRQGKIAYAIPTRIFVSYDATSQIVNEIESNQYFNLEARNWLRQCYQAQEAQFEQFVELAKKDPDFAQLLSTKAEAIQLKAEREAKAEIVKSASHKYTLSWFLSLLDLVKVQEKSVRVPEISFGKCERLFAAEKIYELSECNGRIPAGIDGFDEIPASITYINQQSETKSLSTRLVASEKHQKLRVMFPEVLAQQEIENAHRVLSVQLEFTRRVDLIEELKNGFIRLNLTEATNLKDTLSPQVDFIFGPPGTGKTTNLARALISMEGMNGPVIVLTPTNKAADVLAKKIVEENNNKVPVWLMRAGNCTDPYLLRDGVVKTGDDLLIESNQFAVMITTIHRFPYFTVPVSRSFNDKNRLCDCPWSKVIFDEASMIPLAYITHAIHARQREDLSTHFIVAGDPLQIPPVFDLISEDLDDFAEELQEGNIYTMIGLNSFDKSDQANIPKYGSRIENLSVQHRSIPAIGEIFSKFQYAGKVKHSRGTSDNNKPATSRPLPEFFQQLGFKPVTIIRYPVMSGESIYKPQKLEGSPIHLYSALLVSELVKRFRKEVRNEGGDLWNIGVLAPYRSQADVMLKMIEAHPSIASQVAITIDTVHGFQGDENNLVFAVFNPSGNGDNISHSRFLKKEFIINVAISRAEDYLIMLIPDDDSKGFVGLPLLRELIRLAKETPLDRLSILSAKDLEENLMGQQQFFSTKTFSTAHQKVNVYGKPDLPYMIRLNEKALDVHWQV
ncbi:MAG: AAA domain-containing protein [Flavisolibacter sp.]